MPADTSATTPTPNPDEPSYIVAVGASAGGLEAIDAFFTNVSEDTTFAYVGDSTPLPGLQEPDG
ncbi:MAG: hypothetical protein PF508_03885 [Spirochaeta sp.]|jgi:chemotaxis response regulator CheB|nr:hypothetical protein [Spirochaeta sp.]